MTPATGTKNKLQVGQILVSRGLVTEIQIEQAIAEQAARGHKQLLGEVLIDLGFVTGDEVMEALAEEMENKQALYPEEDGVAMALVMP